MVHRVKEINQKQNYHSHSVLVKDSHYSPSTTCFIILSIFTTKKNTNSFFTIWSR